MAASKVIEAIALLPVVVLFLIRQPELAAPLGAFAAVGGVLVLANYRLLAVAYQEVDLSVAYPVARGAVLFFLPLLGLLFFHEHVPILGIVAVVLIACGVFLQAGAQTTQPRASSRGVWFAVAAGAATACYTIWDKRSIQHLPALTYMSAYTVIVAVV
jgi:drug/metabolite transporter (DMT)-like permease